MAEFNTLSEDFIRDLQEMRGRRGGLDSTRNRRRRQPLPDTPSAATSYIGNTFGLLVCGITTSGVVSVYTIDGDLVWSATIMSYNSGGLHNVLFDPLTGGVVTISQDQDHLVKANSSGTITDDISIGWAGSAGQILNHGLAKNASGVFYFNNDGNYPGERCITGPDGTDYFAATPSGSLHQGSQVYVTDSGYIVNTGNASVGVLGSLWDPSGVHADLGGGSVPGGSPNVCAIDNNTDTLWSVGAEAGTVQLRKVVLSTNTHSYVTSLSGSSPAFAWIPPWGTRLYYGDTTTINSHIISTIPPQVPVMTTAGGNVRGIAGGWATGRKYCVIASASGLSFNDSLGQVWVKAGNFSGCDFLGTSPAY